MINDHVKAKGEGVTIKEKNMKWRSMLQRVYIPLLEQWEKKMFDSLCQIKLASKHYGDKAQHRNMEHSLDLHFEEECGQPIWKEDEAFPELKRTLSLFVRVIVLNQPVP